MSTLVVSIHAPTGGATEDAAKKAAEAAFQFTRPRGARLLQLRIVMSFTSFNSRAHGGRDRPTPAKMARPQVSIHAPTGGAT